MTETDINKITLSLDGPWEFREFPESARRMRDLEGGGWRQVSVPSSIYACLMEAGQIDAFQWRADPGDFDWVSQKSWLFRKTFDAPALAGRHVELIFEGLDTVTQIWLNEKLIGKTDNMFIPHRFDVTPFIRPGSNTIMVKFLPAMAEARRRMLRYGKLSEHHLGDPCRTYLRKAQYQFGSVLGPALPGCGLFRSVSLESRHTASLEDVYIRTIDCSQHTADIRVAVAVRRFDQAHLPLQCRLTVTGGGLNLRHEETFHPRDDLLTTVIRIERPILWWPNGYGVQHLYHLAVELITPEDRCVDEQRRDFGVRMIRLNRASDKSGSAFCFEVNEQPIYVRGANWMPSSMQAVSAPDQCRALLRQCSQSHLNMLRVWAGGYYEDTEFYNLCDQLGILVWQDFMFASAYYPDRQWFKDAVEVEARTVIRRLRSHACLALWCGNSRIDQLHAEGRLGSGRKFYGKTIYHSLLPEVLSELDPDHDYLPSTPFSETGARDHNDPGEGTTHNWQVWNNFAFPGDLLRQPAPRFVTEFGMQSIPDMETLKTFCRPYDLRPGAPGLEKHAWQPGAMARLACYAAQSFAPPASLEEAIFQSQLVQARFLKTYVEYLRLNRSANAGFLFWTLNDPAGAIGFSAYDYLMRPKAAAYGLRQCCAPLLVTLTEDLAGGLFKAVVINDGPKRITATLDCTLLDFSGRTLDQTQMPVTVSPFSVSMLSTLPKIFRYPPAPRQSFLSLQLTANNKTLAENTHFFCPDKQAVWPDADFDMTITPAEDNGWSVRLHALVLIRDLQIIPPQPAQCSDNFITLLPGQTTDILIRYADAMPRPQTPLHFMCVNGLGAR